VAEDINTTDTNQTGTEEEPIVVAQRFLNIFRQMHILTPERKASFDKMLIELQPEIKSLFKTLPGGAPLQEYTDILEHKAIDPHKKADHKNTTILQNALAVPQASGSVGGNFDGGNFAQILANSLAQSNAQIIRELQSSLPASSNSATVASVPGNPLKLVADESFTKIISEALAQALANSEKKRMEDNRIIANSFLELQENLSKMMEQNAQIKYLASSDAPAEAVAGFQLKNVVDDLVKAQSKFLKETTQNQKEELSSLIATAIKESQQLSTQSLIDSFKKMGAENAPTPITYAADSPNSKNSMATVEQAIKAQGKEFSSIISAAIKESQKNSTQTIIETIEELKKSSHGDNNKEPVSAVKIEEIMKMQANLFRDIAKAQNQEFSSLISSALKESQKQSTLAIISALRQFSAAQTAPAYGNYGAYPQSSVWPDPAASYQPVPENILPAEEIPASPQVEEKIPEATPVTQENNTASVSESLSEIENSLIDFEENNSSDTGEVSVDIIEELENTEPKKKKKKKKKKNKEGNTTETVVDENEDLSAILTEALAPSPEKQAPIIPAATSPAQPPVQTIAQLIDKPASAPAEVKKQESPSPTQAPQRKLTMPDAIPSLPELSQIVDKDQQEEDWGWGISTSAVEEENYSAPVNEWQSPKKEIAAQTETPASADDNSENDWEWEYEEVSENAEGVEGEDWEWEYEEVPENAEGAEGEDWEWEYEEVSENAEGVEGEDWEWEYEEVPEESPVPETLASTAENMEQALTTSEIVVDSPFNIILMGIEDNGFKDPYIEEGNETAG